MESLFYSFVPHDGFHWVDAAADDVFFKPASNESRWLSTLSPIGVRANGHVTEPLKETPALFREFASLDLTEVGVRAFADQYGSLGIATAIRSRWSEGDPVRISADGSDDATFALGEPLSLWAKEVTAMKRAIEMWDAAVSQDTGLLREHIRWSDGPGDSRIAEYASHRPGHEMRPEWGDDDGGFEMRTIVDTRLANLSLRSFVSSDDLVRPARLYAQDSINERISAYCAPMLTYGADTDEQQVLLVPQHLLGAMWLQFANSMGGNRQYRRCLACDKWFEIGPGSGRKSRLYCEDACKTRAHRGRQERARVMRDAGESVEQIAASLPAAVESVRRWLGES